MAFITKDRKLSGMPLTIGWQDSYLRLLTRSLRGHPDPANEYVGDFPERGGSRQLLHFGTALKVTNNRQLDFHVGVDVGVGLTPAAADHIIGFGHSSWFFAK
jgi:hypothetical protein